MPHSLAADDVQLWVADPAISEVFSPIAGELRCRISLQREFQRNAALGAGDWRQHQTATGLASVSLELEGRSCQDLAEQMLQHALMAGTSRRLRLKIAGSGWLEGNFLITRYELDAASQEEARFTLQAENQGPPTLTDLI